MLESMRNSAQSWLAKLILGGIAFSFALWGIGDYFMGSRVETVAEVDGKPIVDSEFAVAYERQVNGYRNMLGRQFSRELLEQFHVKDDTLQTLVNRRIMLDEADRLGLVAPENVLVARIQGTPAFRSGNSFDVNRYRLLLRSMGYANPRDFENEERLNMMVDALQQAVMRSATVSDREIRQRFNREYEKRVLEAIVVDPDKLKKGVEISDEQARGYYNDHKKSFMSPLRVKLVAVVIDPAKLADDQEVSDAEVAEAYEAHKADYLVKEKRRARHILIKVAEDASDAVVAAARKKIEAAKARLDKGEAFATVAREVSEDSSAENGGDLGLFGKGQMVPAFEKAAFALKKDETSDIIRSPFGFHIIKLTDIQPEHQKSLEEVRERIRHDLALTKAGDEAYQLSQDLDDALGREGDLAAAASAVNLPLREIGPVSRAEAIGDKLLASSPELINKAFTLTPDDPVEVSELDDGRFVALAVSKRIAPEVEPFARVATRVREALLDEKSREKAEQMAEEILKAARGEKDVDKIAQRFSVPKFISKAVRRNGAGGSADWLSRDVLDSAFKTPEGSWLDEPMETPAGIAVVRVASIEAPDDKLFAEKKEALRQELVKSKGAVRFARWMSSVRSRHDIQTYPEVIERF